MTDPTSGSTYYWNRVTDVTTWEKPVDTTTTTRSQTSNSQNDDLPPGWVKVIHSATQQEYYIHQATNEKRWTKPSISDSQSDIPQPTTRSSANTNTNTNTTTTTNEKKKPRETESQLQEKRRRLQIDPLDPTGGLVKIII